MGHKKERNVQRVLAEVERVKSDIHSLKRKHSEMLATLGRIVHLIRESQSLDELKAEVDKAVKTLAERGVTLP